VPAEDSVMNTRHCNICVCVCLCYADGVTRINGAPHLARQLQEASRHLMCVAHYCYQQAA
jgi:hypothetical protein